MRIYCSRITDHERTTLRTLSQLLTKIATHELTKKLAVKLLVVADAGNTEIIPDGFVDALGEEMETAWQNMFSRQQALVVGEFHAAGEIRFALRGVGMNAPESFADNVADALRAINKVKPAAERVAA